MQIIPDVIFQTGRDREEFMREIATFYKNDSDSAIKVIRGGYAFLSTWDYFPELWVSTM